MAVRFARDGCATGGGDDATGVNTLWRGVDLLFLPPPCVRSPTEVVIAAVCGRNWKLMSLTPGAVFVYIIIIYAYSKMYNHSPCFYAHACIIIYLIIRQIRITVQIFLQNQMFF